jgi:SAM-dependent methyltransferase
MFHPNGPTFWELAVQALSSTERGYDLLAPKFDFTPFRTPQPILDAVQEQLRPLGPFGSGLDVCCGTGAGMELLRPLCRERVVGIDFSRGMLEVARNRTAAAPRPGELPAAVPQVGAPLNKEARLEFVRGDALALPFGPVFDIIVCFGAHGHILERDEPRFVHEVARVLAPGGRFAFVTTYLPRRTSLSYWMARGFNAAMRIRNLLHSPPFIMYYLTFLLPGVRTLLEREGLRVEENRLGNDPRWTAGRLVVATRPA